MEKLTSEEIVDRLKTIEDKLIKANEQGFSSYPKSKKDYLEIQLLEYGMRTFDYHELSSYKKIIYFFSHVSALFKMGKTIAEIESLEETEELEAK